MSSDLTFKPTPCQYITITYKVKNDRTFSSIISEDFDYALLYGCNSAETPMIHNPCALNFRLGRFCLKSLADTTAELSK